MTEIVSLLMWAKVQSTYLPALDCLEGIKLVLISLLGNNRFDLMLLSTMLQGISIQVDI